MTTFCVELYTREQNYGAIAAVFVRGVGSSFWTFCGATRPFYGDGAGGRATIAAEEMIATNAAAMKIGHDYKIIDRR